MKTCGSLPADREPISAAVFATLRAKQYSDSASNETLAAQQHELQSLPEAG